MKLSAASKHLSTAGRGGGSRLLDDINAARGRGIAQQAKAQTMDNSDSLGSSTEKKMPMDKDGHQRRGYAYKGESPWSAPPVKNSDPTVLHSTTTDNTDPQIRQFAGTINVRFSIIDKWSKINVSLLRKRLMAFVKQTDGSFHIEPLNGSA
jgi:hypothetical protein